MKKKIIPISIGLFLVLIAAFSYLYSLPVLTQIETSLDTFMYDSALRANLISEGVLPEGLESIVIVDIDETSIRSLGHWPWPRDDVANLVNEIRKLGAIVISFDILFSESPKNPVSEILAEAKGPFALDDKAVKKLEGLLPQFNYDEILRKSFKKEDTVMGFLLHDERKQPSHGTLPLPLTKVDNLANTEIISLRRYLGNIASLQETAENGGFITSRPDEDGVARKAALLLGFGNNVYPSLALETFRITQILEKKDIRIQWGPGDDGAVEGIQLGEKFIPTDEEGLVLIPFTGRESKYRHISAVEIAQGKLAPNALKNAVVFIGSSALSLGDFHATPINPSFPGVDVHAYVTEGLLTGQFLSTPYYADSLTLGVIVVVGVGLALLLPFLDALWMVLAFLGAMALTLGLYGFLFRAQNILISVSIPLLLNFSQIGFNLVYGMLFEFRRRSQLKNLFGQYVPGEIVERMSENPELYTMDGTSETLTVLFADVVSFTTVSESLTPKQIRKLLNAYFTPMTKIILDSSGTIDKYVGDMLMAFWGAPLHDPDHAKHALGAALDMHRTVVLLAPEFNKQGLPGIEIRIGLNTGIMSVGDMGSEYRRAYTVLGDTVNAGSRIEGLTRLYGIGIAVGAHTREGQNDFVFRLIDRVKVKGKHQAIEIFELVGRTSESTPQLSEQIALHEKAMQLYFAQNFKEAATIFTELLESGGNRLLYQLYLDRIRKFEIAPPPPDWDGSTEWAQK